MYVDVNVILEYNEFTSELLAIVLSLLLQNITSLLGVINNLGGNKLKVGLQFISSKVVPT